MRCRTSFIVTNVRGAEVVFFDGRGLLDVVLYEIGCDVAPEREGDASSWLEAIRRRLLMSNSGPLVRRSGEPQPWETP